MVTIRFHRIIMGKVLLIHRKYLIFLQKYLLSSYVLLFCCRATANIFTKLSRQCLTSYFFFVVTNNQGSVYRTIGPLVKVYIGIHEYANDIILK